MTDQQQKLLLHATDGGRYRNRVSVNAGSDDAAALDAMATAGLMTPGATDPEIYDNLVAYRPTEQGLAVAAELARQEKLAKGLRLYRVRFHDVQGVEDDVRWAKSASAAKWDTIEEAKDAGFSARSALRMIRSVRLVRS